MSDGVKEQQRVALAPAARPLDPLQLDSAIAELISAARTARERGIQRRAARGLGLSALVSLAWLIAVVSLDLWPRVAEHWAAAVTMIFGSVVAGLTPQGGGAVAFPVFTKLLEVPSEVARSFSLCIQTVGMGTASLAIVINRRPVEWRAVGVAGIGAVVGFLAVVLLGSDPSRPFLPPLIPGSYVKVTFTIVLTAMAFVVFRGAQIPVREIHRLMPPLNLPMTLGLTAAGLLGGISAALVGSGADVMIYLALTIFFTVDPKVGVPTSVILMAAISCLGFAVLGVGEGQLLVSLDAGQQHLASVSGRPVTLTPSGQLAFTSALNSPAPVGRFDVFGFWVAAFPVVAWGAPIGSWLAAKISSRNLTRLIVGFALAEVVSTAVYLDDLRTDPVLLAYALLGTAVLLGLLQLVSIHRGKLFGLPEVDLDRSVNSERVDIASHFHES